MSAMYHTPRSLPPGTRLHAYLAGFGRRPRARLVPWVRWQTAPVAPVGCDQSRRPNRLIDQLALRRVRIQRWLGAPVSVSSSSPRVNVERFPGDRPREEYNPLSVCRQLVPYKRVTWGGQAFQPQADSLIVVGEDRSDGGLGGMAGPHCWTFLGHRSTSSVNELMGAAAPYVYGGLEDFRNAAVEAMAAVPRSSPWGTGGLLDSEFAAWPAAPAKPNRTVVGQADQHGPRRGPAFFEEGQLWKRLPAEEQQRWGRQFKPERFRDGEGPCWSVLGTEHVKDQGNTRTALPFPPGLKPLLPLAGLSDLRRGGSGK